MCEDIDRRNLPGTYGDVHGDVCCDLYGDVYVCGSTIAILSWYAAVIFIRALLLAWEVGRSAWVSG